MRIRTLKNFLHDRNYRRGEELDVTGTLARQLTQKGLAVVLTDDATDATDEGKSDDDSKSSEKGSAEGEKPGKTEKAK
ncbi:hypothetical protein G6K88_07695 [Agrobacterium rhizogenes]|uniref:hypothetical protein n=1 Tax=Rhizobium rhizogenes TaxID=359 RepID=UPI00157306B0|nr:hypothetical protein [Rhizobium rhizogenes]NTF80841.1 hypothetical protein [Rhizobium rhizogenes]NTI01900.1 hypothetical protein [Rhizobium rhizogenes]NTI08703.1 hypothetical protein [Rhizobium rhizogenes]